jgi:protease-4
MRKFMSIFIVLTLTAAAGCGAPRIKLFPSQADPLEESVLEGTSEGKVLVVPIQGIISDRPEEGFMRTRPSSLQEAVSHLRKAARDPQIKAVVLQLDSPGGTVTASDILYRELLDFKEKTGRPVVAAMMDVAASGAYYIALAADRILAHPTTVTGSVGVIFMRPKVAGLMDKIGVGFEVTKSGKNKDLGSPFRATTPEEERLFQAMADQLGKRFQDLVARHRTLSAEQLAEVSSAKVYLADEALRLKLVDLIGYMPEALKEARRLAQLPEDARVVVYRRLEYPDDNIYNPATSYDGDRPAVLLDLGLRRVFPALEQGFYYLWLPAAD